jgi:hypothetical protein
LHAKLQDTHLTLLKGQRQEIFRLQVLPGSNLSDIFRDNFICNQLPSVTTRSCIHHRGGLQKKDTCQCQIYEKLKAPRGVLIAESRLGHRGVILQF